MTTQAASDKPITSIAQFFDLVWQMIYYLYGKDWVVYRHAFPVEEDAENLPVPLLTYRVAQVTPSELGKEQPRKPRMMGHVPTGDPRVANVVHLQHFDYIVHFRFWHRDHNALYRMVEQFLDMMTFHLGTLKAHGVDDCFLYIGEEEMPQQRFHRAGIVDFDLTFYVRLKRIHEAPLATISDLSMKGLTLNPSPQAS